MPAADDDWRLRGQEAYLTAAHFEWREWVASPAGKTRSWRLADGTVMTAENSDAVPPRGAVEEIEPRRWTHDHCDFCWNVIEAEANHSAATAAVEREPTVITAAYVSVGSVSPGVWVCPECFEDFRERMAWTIESVTPH